MSIHRVAFCGLGTMGAGMVRNLMAAGFSVTGWNRTASRAEPLVRAGMALAATPREAASDSDVVVLCLSDDAAVREVALDADSGALSGIGTGSLVIDCSTTGPSLTRELETEVLERGGAFIDAPITGSKLGAEGGKLTYMVGGPSAAVARARPVFEATSKYVVHVGDQVGLGQSAK